MVFRFLPTMSETRLDDAVRRGIAEYLSYHGFHDTLHAFSTESQRVRATGATRRQPLTTTRMARLRQDFVRFFDAGEKDEFFRLWTAYVPWDVQQDEPFAQRLEFYLHIHFAVTPFRRAGPAAPVPPDAETYLREFRQYLEGPGQQLAQTSEFLCVAVRCPAMARLRVVRASMLVIILPLYNSLSALCSSFLQGILCTSVRAGPSSSPKLPRRVFHRMGRRFAKSRIAILPANAAA